MADERPDGTRDSVFMRRALVLARRGWGQTAPNPMVGAVVVRDGEIVAEGWHRRYGEAHAEVLALARAGERARGATVYVTLEPCAHVGKTSACADALIAAGVRRVVIAARDPNPVAAGGLARLRAAGIEVEVGVEERAARELDPPFFHAFASDRPWVTLKLAISLDAALTDAWRARGWITGAKARREVHRLRANADAIGVGVQTVISDDPSLTVRGVRAPRVPPRRVIFDRTARTPVEATLARTARDVPTIVIAQDPDPGNAARLQAAGVEVLAAPSMDDALRTLRAGGVRSLLVEGGARIAGALLRHDLVDRLIIFQAPIILGAGALPAFAEAPPSSLAEARRLEPLEQRRLGTDVMTIYAMERR